MRKSLRLEIWFNFLRLVSVSNKSFMGERRFFFGEDLSKAHEQWVSYTGIKNSMDHLLIFRWDIFVSDWIILLWWDVKYWHPTKGAHSHLFFCSKCSDINMCIEHLCCPNINFNKNHSSPSNYNKNTVLKCFQTKLGCIPSLFGSSSSLPAYLGTNSIHLA